MSDHCCVTIDGAVFTIIISIYLDNFLQVEEQRIYCLALGEIVELEEWIHGEGNIFSTTNVKEPMPLKWGLPVIPTPHCSDVSMFRNISH
jgi:hypothetical protein